MLKFLLYITLAAACVFIGTAVFQHLETHGLRVKAAAVTRNARRALYAGLEGVITAQSGGTVPLATALSAASTGNPMKISEPAYVYGAASPRCGQVWLSTPRITPAHPEVSVRVGLGCSPSLRTALRESLVEHSLRQLLSSAGIRVSAAREALPGKPVKTPAHPWEATLWQSVRNTL